VENLNVVVGKVMGEGGGEGKRGGNGGSGKGEGQVEGGERCREGDMERCTGEGKKELMV